MELTTRLGKEWNPSTDGIICIEPTPIPGTLIAPGTLSAQSWYSEAMTDSKATFTLNATNIGTNTTVSGSISLALVIMNTTSYFSMLWKNKIIETDSSRLINFSNGNVVNYNQQGNHIKLVSASSQLAFPKITGLSIDNDTVNNLGTLPVKIPGIITSETVNVVGTFDQLDSIVVDRFESIRTAWNAGRLNRTSK